MRTDQQNLTQDQDRVRRNIESLRNVAGQQDLVQQYARQLAANETQLAALRDKESDLRKKKTSLEGELNGLIDRAEFSGDEILSPLKRQAGKRCRGKRATPLTGKRRDHRVLG